MNNLKFRVWTNAYMSTFEYRPVCQIRWNVNRHITVNACSDPINWIPVVFPNKQGSVLEQRISKKWVVVIGKRKNKKRGCR